MKSELTICSSAGHAFSVPVPSGFPHWLRCQTANALDVLPPVGNETDTREFNEYGVGYLCERIREVLSEFGEAAETVHTYSFVMCFPRPGGFSTGVPVGGMSGVTVGGRHHVLIAGDEFCVRIPYWNGGDKGVNYGEAIDLRSLGHFTDDDGGLYEIEMRKRRGRNRFVAACERLLDRLAGLPGNASVNLL